MEDLSDQADGSLYVTGQQATSWSDPARAMTASGGEPSGWHGSWPSPEAPEVEVTETGARQLEHGEPGGHADRSWEDVPGQSWGPS